MFGISFEHILIVGVVLLVMGPKRLPELGNTMGKAIKNFKDAISGIEEANFKRINPDPPASENPVAVNPVATTAEVVTATTSPVADSTTQVNPAPKKDDV